MNQDERLIIRSWADVHGIELSTHQIELIGIYLGELIEWNRHINLTGVCSRQRVIQELLLDSLMPSTFLPRKGRLLDLGSGGGFPGIPLKICMPWLQVHLIESNRKKVNFLKHVIRVAGLEGIEVIRGRIEKDNGCLWPDGYGIVTARAVADLSRTLTWCAPHLIEGGYLVNFQGSQFKEAIADSADILEKEHISLYKTVPYVLENQDSPRYLLIFIKNR